ncbi:MAG TPA: DNA polymerase III subunit delta [Wenzhouxiangella sp.]
MKAFPERLPAMLQSQLANVYLVAGPEALLVEEATDAIRSAAKTHGLSERVVLDADARFDWGSLTRATETGSLFASRRLVELNLPTGKPGQDGGSALREWVAEPRDDVLLIKCAAWELASEKSVWFKAIDQAGVFVPCWAVKPHQLPKWIASRLSSRGLSIDGPSAQFLADRLEGNLLAAAQEVERLALLYPNNHRLTLAELKEAVSDNARFDAYRLTELVLTGQIGAALRCIRGLAETDVYKPLVVSALSRELSVIGSYLILSKTLAEQQVFKQLKVWPSRQEPIKAAARRLSVARVGEALAELSVLDGMSKSKQSVYFWMTLERFCVALCTGQSMAYVGSSLSDSVVDDAA